MSTAPQDDRAATMNFVMFSAAMVLGGLLTVVLFDRDNSWGWATLGWGMIFFLRALGDLARQSSERRRYR